MSDQARSAYRRLILDLCHGTSDAESMRAAVEFARLLGLDLHCLFIEDEAVLALAELPFAREIRLPTHDWSPIDVSTIEAELRQAANQTRRLLDKIIEGIGISSEFEVLRGDPAACIAALCRSGDIVVVAEPGPPLGRTTQSVMRLRAAAHESAASVLLLPTRLRPRRGPVVAVLADAADASLDVGCRIATAAEEDLVILLPEPLAAAAGVAVADRVTDRARALGLPRERITVQPVRGAQADDVVHALSGLRERLIVMTRASSAASDATGASRIAAARGVPVLLLEAEAQANR
ncbi:conserved hypothetical protein [Burkholderiales bacterium]|nr:conserved hypothetical protein [Burkholderiales bacterium]